MNHKKLAGILEEPAKFIYSSAKQVLEEYCVNRVLQITQASCFEDMQICDKHTACFITNSIGLLY